MTSKDAIKQKIETEDDYIHCPKANNSLKQLMDDRVDGIDDAKIAKVLMIRIDEVEQFFQSALSRIRKKLNIED